MRIQTKIKFFNIIMESLYYLGAFLLPFLLIIGIFSSHGFALTSLNGYTVISMDFQSEYIAYLRYFREMLINDGFVNVYTLSKVFGGDFYSIYTFYLSSPFNFFIRFVSEAQIPLFALWMNILKMSLAGVSMYTLLRFTSKKRSIFNIGVSTAYGMLVYAFIYGSNYMWLDAIMVLPLVILGIKFIINNKNPIIYLLSLAYAYLTSWYMGALLTVFICLFFIAEFINDERKFKEKYKVLIRFAVFSVVAALLCATNWLTAFTHFDGTKANAQFGQLQLLPLTMFFTGMFENGYMTHNFITMNVGYMPIFVSIGCLALAIMFFFNKGYSLKRRLSYLAIFVFYFIFSNVNVLNSLMHGGREPTWFPARFAFCISFFICYIAALNFHKKKEVPIYGIVSPLILATIILPIVVVIPNHLLPEGYQTYTISIVSIVIFFLVVGLLLLEKFLPTKIQQKNLLQPILSGVLLGLLVFSSYRGANNVVTNNQKQPEFYQTYETYLKDDKYGDFINEEWGSTYRSVTTFNRDGAYNEIDNNPMFYSFNGLSNYSSSSKKEVEGYMQKLGFHYNYFFAKYDGGSTLSINSLLGVKHIYDNGESGVEFLNSEGLEVIDQQDELIKYQNNYALPLAFYSKATQDSFISEGYKGEGKQETYWYDQIEYQNQLFKTLSGLDEDIFKPVEMTAIFESNLNYVEDEYGLRRYTSINNENSTITAKFKYNEPIDNMHNFYFVEKSNTDCRTYHNGENIGVSSYWHKGIRSIPVKQGEEITIRILYEEMLNNVEIRPRIYVEDLNVLKKHIDIIEDKNLEFTSSRNIFASSFKGTITTDGSMDDLIFTIPHEDRIQVKIDGKIVDSYKKLNVFTGVDISSLSNGEHTVEISYIDTGLIAGFVLMMNGIIFASLICTYYFLSEERREFIKSKLKFSK